MRRERGDGCGSALGRGGRESRARVVYPVQVVEEEEEGLLPADRSQGPHQLVEQGPLRQGPLREWHQARPAARRGQRRGLTGSALNRGSRNEHLDQSIAVPGQCGQDERRGILQTIGLRTTTQRPGRLAGQIPEERICKPAQGRKGVEAAARAASARRPPAVQGALSSPMRQRPRAASSCRCPHRH